MKGVTSGQMLNKQKITLTIPTADGDLLHYSAVASEALESASKAPAAEVAASSCLRRAAALAGLGLELWG